MAKGASISGFPEWLPSERVVEQRVIDTLRNVFELNGFIGIETRAVEQGSSLLKKGETSKEIYLLSRLQEVGHESDTPIEDRLGLHFDLTVPLSRYVVEHSGDLAFPFKRWQIQKVWRGERPQEGRFREFVQADIDVIGNGDLPDHYEVELPLVMVSALERLREFGLPKATVHANNRKLSEGFYRGLGLTDIEGVLREIDKLDKIGPEKVGEILIDDCGLTRELADEILKFIAIRGTNDEVLAALEQYRGDLDVLENLRAIKRKNKVRLAAYIAEHNGVNVDPDSIFDVQVKRLHEYKRQLLNALSIMDLYLSIKDGSIKDFTPTAFIFGAKAAPGYRRAKAIIHYVNRVADLINSDPAMDGVMKVGYIVKKNQILSSVGKLYIEKIQEFLHAAQGGLSN